MLEHSIINMPRTERRRENAKNFDFLHAFFVLHCYNTITITQVYFCQGFNAWSLCNQLAKISMVPRQCLKFSFSHHCIIMILQLLYRVFYKYFNAQSLHNQVAKVSISMAWPLCNQLIEVTAVLGQSCNFPFLTSYFINIILLMHTIYQFLDMFLSKLGVTKNNVMKRKTIDTFQLSEE